MTEKPLLQRLTPGLAAIAIVLVIAGIWLTISMQDTAVKYADRALNAPRPSLPAGPTAQAAPKLSLIVITASSCADCANLSTTLEGLRSIGFQITGERTLDYSEQAAKELVRKYGAAKVPTVLVQGDTKDSKVSAALKGFGEINADGTIVFTGQQPPYIDTATGSVAGRVNVTVLQDERCTTCQDYSTVADQFKMVGIAIDRQNMVEYNSTEGRALVEKYSLDKVPAVLLSANAWEYSVVQNAWDNVGTRESDGTLVLRKVTPPYRELENGTIVGLVTLIDLANTSCKKCYDVGVHRKLFERIGVVFKTETTYDVNTAAGRQYLEKYNITKTPTVLLSPEASAYPVIQQLWEQLGTNESDGWLVFRSMDALPDLVYYDSELGRIVGNATNATQPAG